MCKKFEKKLIKSLGGQVRVNPVGDLEDGEIFIRIDKCILGIDALLVLNCDRELLVCRIPEDWQKWDELIALIKSAVRLYREGK